MKKFIKIRAVAGASATCAEIQNSYAYNKFTEFIINTDCVARVYPLENDLTNRVYDYFKVELITGALVYCHKDDYKLFAELLSVDSNPCVVVNLTNPDPVKEAPAVQVITDTEPVVESKPKKVKSIAKTTTKSKKVKKD